MDDRKSLVALAVTLAIVLSASIFVDVVIKESWTPSAVTGSTTQVVRDVPVGAVLYLWYGYNFTSGTWTGGLGTSHWNDSSFGIVVDRPAIGYYASDDNATLAWQLSEIRSSGISWILASWWGPGNATQSRGYARAYSAINNATLNLFRFLSANRQTYPIKVALLVENFNGTQQSPYDLTPSDFAHLYGYVDSHFYRPFNDSVFYWRGKPLICSFNGWLGRLPMNDSFTYRLIGSPINDYDWSFWQGDGYLTATNARAPWHYEQSPQISTDGEVGLIWRYDDYYLRPNSYMRFDPNGTLGLYGYEWGFAISNANHVNLVLLYSWNEYHERSTLEPHQDLTAKSPPGDTETLGYINRLDGLPPKPEGGSPNRVPLSSLLPGLTGLSLLGLSVSETTTRIGFRRSLAHGASSSTVSARP